MQPPASAAYGMPMEQIVLLSVGACAAALSNLRVMALQTSSPILTKTRAVCLRACRPGYSALMCSMQAMARLIKPNYTPSSHARRSLTFEAN
jgi:hypothetical protein